MTYAVPGTADDLDESLVHRWNECIKQHFTRIFADQGSRFVSPDPASLMQPEQVELHWFADPAELVTCLDPVSARRLCDWGARGRNFVQDEYAEYAIEWRSDESGRMRPKRVQVTTELREFWLTVATADPDALAAMAENVVGRRPSWIELYGVEDPHSLSEDVRAAQFVHQVAGERRRPPAGELNRNSALFMTHSINGLDDLIYIVMFGAHPYSVRLADGTRRPASRDEIFSLVEDTKILACRHADPIAALGAQEAALDGRTVAFADPLGMYIRSFNEQALSLEGGSLPDGWILWGRGEDGMRQRLVVGPPDDDDRFLDEIMVSVGAANEPLVGGFQLLRLIEVGPLVVRSAPTPVADSEFVEVDVLEGSIDCSESWACDSILQLKELLDKEQERERTGKRTVVTPGG